MLPRSMKPTNLLVNPGPEIMTFFAYYCRQSHKKDCTPVIKTVNADRITINPMSFICCIIRVHKFGRISSFTQPPNFTSASPPAYCKQRRGDAHRRKMTVLLFSCAPSACWRRTLHYQPIALLVAIWWSDRFIAELSEAGISNRIHIVIIVVIISSSNNSNNSEVALWEERWSANIRRLNNYRRWRESSINRNGLASPGAWLTAQTT